MFSADAVQKAQAVLDQIEITDRVPVTVETIPSLNGEDIAEASLERAQRESKPGQSIVPAC